MSEGARLYAFPVRHDRLVDKRTAARELGIGVRTLERMMREGRIHYTRPSGHPMGAVRFRWSVIDDLKRRNDCA